MTDCINEVLESSKYPESLKLSDIVPVYKKKDPTDKSNFRPISILPLLSKVFEKVIFDQLSNYMNNFLNSLLCGFRKAHSTQHALFRLLQAWQKELDQCGFVGTVLMDLSKAYDCLPHDLLIAKLEAYGLDTTSLSLIKNYLANRKQRTKVGSSYSDWFEFLRGIPQGSILGPLLFNIFINDIFFEIQKSNICNFADDNTLYFCSQDLQTVIENLTYDVKNVLTWFKINSMKANPEKFQFMILSKTRRLEYNLLIDSNVIKESADVELLGLIIDNKLSFEKHIARLCQTATYKLHALRRLRKYLTLEKARVLGNAFVDSQFNYAPLIWMFCKKTIYLKMQKIHHKTLRIIYQSDESYENLLNLDNSVSLHQRHLRFLVTEIFKSVSKTNPKFMFSYFSCKNLS